VVVPVQAPEFEFSVRMIQPPADDFHAPLKLALWVVACADPDSPITVQQATSSPTMTAYKDSGITIFIVDS
jgi:hypothetical protein